MDRKRLRELKVRSRQQFLEVGSDREFEAAERLLADCEREGQSVYACIDRRFAQYERLLELTRALNAEPDLDQLLEQIVDASIELCGAERGVLLLGGADAFQTEVARRFGGQDLTGLDLQFSRTIAAQVIRQRRMIRLEDALGDRRLAQQPSVQQMQLRSILAVPLRGRSGVLGALYLDNRFAQDVFDGDNEAVLQTLADQASVAIENARLRHELAQRTVEVEQLNHSLQQRMETISGIMENQRQQLGARASGFHQILGRTPRMREVFEQIERIGKAGIAVLIQGESGTGKELVARAIHAVSRRGGPFISENCAAIAESLAESELFGYVAGAFTGASRPKKGLFELAQGGTLFLDEVADMSDGTQKKLLRVLQENEVRPIGAKQPVALDVRILSAANQSIEQLVAAGAFREDLFFRLRGYTIELPPLRERREDIPLLIECFLDGRPVERRALDALLSYDWPGNIRELQNECHSMAALSDGKIRREHLSPAIGGAFSVPARGQVIPLDAEIEVVERKAIVRALALTRNKSEAAVRLQISRYTLNRKLEKYGLDA